MLSIIFDTETTGVPKKKKGLITDDKNWPYIVQLAWILFDMDSCQIIKQKNYIIRLPDLINIPAEATQVHKITNAQMIKEGKNAATIFKEFMDDLVTATYVVAHNINFDLPVLRAELYRKKMYREIGIIDKGKFIKFCTMKYGVPICNLTMISKKTGKTIPKWPKLQELHYTLFKQTLNQDMLHDALIDIMICMRCFYKMMFDEDMLLTNVSLDEEFSKIICKI